MQNYKDLGTICLIMGSLVFGTIEAETFFLPEPIMLSHHHMMRLDLELESNNSYIHFVQDPANIGYLFKQKKEMYLAKMVLYSVRDMLASIIAYVLNIPSNYVWFVPAYVDFPGKKIQNSPATLHTRVPGTVVASIKHLSPKIRIKQFSAKKNPESAGLTEGVIRSMTLHHDLPPLVALDTIVSNADRHNRNILYDEVRDKFYGIDMDSTFRLESEIVPSSCTNVLAMINDPSIQFSRKELRAIRMYKKTLELYLQTFSLRILHKLVDECFKKTGYIVRGTTDTNVAIIHAVVNVNYAEIKRLVQLLDRLIAAKKNRAEEEQSN